MNLYSDNINKVTPQSFSQGLQQRVDRLQKDANRLFSLGNIRKHCQMALMRFLANQQPSPYANWGMQLSHDREFLDHVVTSCIVLTGGGETVQTAGGYLREEAERQLKAFFENRRSKQS